MKLPYKGPHNYWVDGEYTVEIFRYGYFNFGYIIRGSLTVTLFDEEYEAELIIAPKTASFTAAQAERRAHAEVAALNALDL